MCTELFIVFSYSFNGLVGCGDSLSFIPDIGNFCFLSRFLCHWLTWLEVYECHWYFQRNGFQFHWCFSFFKKTNIYFCLLWVYFAFVFSYLNVEALIVHQDLPAFLIRVFNDLNFPLSTAYQHPTNFELCISIFVQFKIFSNFPWDFYLWPVGNVEVCCLICKYLRIFWTSSWYWVVV